MAVSEITICFNDICTPLRQYANAVIARYKMDYDQFMRNIVKCSDWPDEFRTKLIEHRGGCRCCDPGAHPPCNNCTKELSYDEVVDLGFIIDAHGQFIDMDHECPTEIEGEWVEDQFKPKKP